MVEERWHDFVKEKPSEDMEGRNFIVSNGHYEKIATWCGYWENEPFMGDRLCDEVVFWKFYFTPEEEKANEATCNELFVEESYNGGKYYDKDAVDALLAKKDKEIESLMASHYAEMVDAGMRERRLKRALWLARAERADDKARIFYFAETCGVALNINGYSNKEKGCTRMRNARWWMLTWLRVERKCREKAEEYR